MCTRFTCYAEYINLTTHSAALNCIMKHIMKHIGLVGKELKLKAINNQPINIYKLIVCCDLGIGLRTAIIA